eukprot:10359982-Ditylum_brightwellii.AAC.1
MATSALRLLPNSLLQTAASREFFASLTPVPVARLEPSSNAVHYKTSPTPSTKAMAKFKTTILKQKQPNQQPSQ